MEFWKQIPSHPNYEVSDHGRIRNQNGRILKQFLTVGYPCVALAYGSTYVHRAVAECFCERKEGQDQVNHKDLDKTNNAPSNLEWCTARHNSQHYVDAGAGVQKPYHLIDPEGREYKGVNLNILCREHNLQQGNLHKVVKGQRKSHKGWTLGGAHV